jgi:vitamin B12 transporter
MRRRAPALPPSAVFLRVAGHPFMLSRGARGEETASMQPKLLYAALLLAVSAGAHAASPDQAETLQSVEVTATRTTQAIADALAPVTVITRADIERLQPASVQDLLTGLPGVSFANSGGVGQQTSLFLRGTNSAHTLVLVDGLRIGTVGAGLPAFEQLPLDQIERIEIVRGPRSSLYGADAIGGVIQIFTRHGTPGGAMTPSFRLSGGSHDTWDSQVGLSGGSEHAWYNVSLGAQYTHGINSCRDGAGTVFAGCFANEPDDDGYRAYSGLLNAGYRWDNGTELAGNVLRTTSFIDYDGSFQNESRHAQQVAGAKLSFAPTDIWQVTLTAGQTLDKASNFHDGAFTGYADSRRNQASWQNDLTLAENQLLTLGADYQQEHVDSDTGYLRSTRDNVAAYAQYQGTFGAEEVQLSARRDHNQQFGNHNTGAVAWGHHFGDGLLLSASWGTAFHAPTFNDLYYPSFPGFPPSADPQLKPEKSRNAELGLGARHDRWHWQLNAYQNDIRQLIALDANFTPGNISRARLRGIEGQLGGQSDGWTWAGYLTWQRPLNRDGGPNDGNLLPRRFERSARVDLDRALGDFSVGTTVYAAGYRYDDIANVHRLGGYATVDLRASWQFRPQWQLQVRVANAFDRDYETAYYFNQPGRTAMLTLRYTP